jgi:hypothetical protein
MAMTAPFDALEAFKTHLQDQIGIQAIIVPTAVKSVATTIRIRPEGVSFRNKTQADRSPDTWAIRLAVWVEAAIEGPGLGLQSSLDAAFNLAEFFGPGVRPLPAPSAGVFFAGEVREDTVLFSGDAGEGMYQFSASYSAVLYGGRDHAPPAPKSQTWVYLASIGPAVGPVVPAGTFVRIEALDGASAFPSWVKENDLFYCVHDLELAAQDRVKEVAFVPFGPARMFKRVFTRLKVDASGRTDETAYGRTAGRASGSGTVQGVAEDDLALAELLDRFVPQVTFGVDPQRTEVTDRRVHFLFGNMDDFLAGTGTLEYAPAILRELELTDDTLSTGAFRLAYEQTEAGRPCRIRLE